MFVGGLAWATTDDSLQQFFAQAGNVVSAKVIMDRMTGKSRGFGFVEMASDAEAKEAVAKLKGQVLDGRHIVVHEARPQTDRNPSFDRNSRPDRGGRDDRRGR